MGSDDDDDRLESLEEGDAASDDALDVPVPKVALTWRERLSQCTKTYGNPVCTLVSGGCTILACCLLIAWVTYMASYWYHSGLS